MPNKWMQKLDRAIDAQRKKIVRVRRDLHMYPEPSGREVETTRYLVKLLQQTGCHIQMGPRGCGVIADNTLEKTRIGMRADIDALRIQDAKNVPYRSRVPGVMHACGHDGHTATVLGAVLGLLECDRVLPWPVHWRAIFQPAEETNRGAKDMIAFGALKNVCGLLSLHLDPSRPTGTVGTRKGVLTANCAEIEICIQGRGGHAARPRETRDPIVAAAQIITALYQSLPRNVDTYDPIVISIGHISAGENPNVIPGQALLRGTLRTLSGSSQAHAMDHILKIAHGIANLTDTEIDVRFLTGPSSVNNDPALTELIRQNAIDLLGQTHVQTIARPSMGGEDFANYLDHVPGSLFRLGCMPARGSAPPLHAPDFDIDERALVIGAKILARSVVNYFDPSRKKNGACHDPT
ncbi:MAG: amidohydrolase [Gemmatimonadetes bacterium]|nr:amidohydrolase [Gemmatimonadota bacterium]